MQNFQMYDGVLYCTKTEDGSLVLRVVIPQPLRRYALNVAHDAKASGHTFERAVDLFYSSSMLKDCCEYAKSCKLCQERKGTKGTEFQREGLPEVTLPLQRVSLDLTDLYGSNAGFRYVLTMADAYLIYFIQTGVRNSQQIFFVLHVLILELKLL